jgi:hypothetical protein
MQDERYEEPATAVAPRRTGRRLLLALVLLLLIGVGAVFAAQRVPALQARLDSLLGLKSPTEAPAAAQAAAPTLLPPAVPQVSPQIAQPVPVAPLAPSSADSRLAMLEARIAQLDLQAQAASGNATRAEGLLIAFATRRTLDRGAPLGYLEDQLKLRFADAQPNAVQTLIEAAAKPVTLDQLDAELAALKPKLTGSAPGESSWSRVKRELAGLFVVRQQAEASAVPEDKVERAQLLLASGKVTEAIAEVGRMRGAAAALPWISSAKRYDAVQRALDLIETTAMLEPRRLRDDAGAAVDQPSPIAAPTPESAPAI